MESPSKLHALTVATVEVAAAAAAVVVVVAVAAAAVMAVVVSGRLIPERTAASTTRYRRCGGAPAQRLLGRSALRQSAVEVAATQDARLRLRVCVRTDTGGSEHEDEQRCAAAWQRAHGTRRLLCASPARRLLLPVVRARLVARPRRRACMLPLARCMAPPATHNTGRKAKRQWELERRHVTTFVPMKVRRR